MLNLDGELTQSHGITPANKPVNANLRSTYVVQDADSVATRAHYIDVHAYPQEDSASAGIDALFVSATNHGPGSYLSYGLRTILAQVVHAAAGIMTVAQPVESTIRALSGRVENGVNFRAVRGIAGDGGRIGRATALKVDKSEGVDYPVALEIVDPNDHIFWGGKEVEVGPVQADGYRYLRMRE